MVLPDEDVDLLVDDVNRQDTEAVFLLNRARGTVLVEGALGNLREHPGHGVGPVLRFHFGVGQDVAAIAHELSSEEEVSEVDLPNDVDKVEDLAEEELEGVERVSAAVQPPVLDDVVDLVGLGVVAEQRFLKEEVAFSLLICLWVIDSLFLKTFFAPNSLGIYSGCVEQFVFGGCLSQ